MKAGKSGCLAKARVTPFGNLDEWIPLDVWATGLDADIHPMVVADREYQSGLVNWRQCMHTQGYDVGDGIASREQIAQMQRALPSAEALDRERQQAMADATCNESSGLRKTAIRLHTELQRQAFNREPVKFDEYRKRHDGAVAQAWRIASELSQQQRIS